MLKKTLLGVVALLLAAAVIILAIATTKPDTFEVERERVMAAPAAAVFANLNDFRRWERWSPWEKLDANLKRTYSGAEQGVGATYAWQGNSEAGAGQMTITESTPPQRLKIRLEFTEPFASTNTTTFDLTPVGDQIRVTWRMVGANTFMGKVFSIFFDMDEMIGKDFERGLTALEEVSQSQT